MKQLENGNYMVNLSIPLRLTNLDDSELEVKQMVVEYLSHLAEDDDNLDTLSLKIKRMGVGKKTKKKVKKTKK